MVEPVDVMSATLKEIQRGTHMNNRFVGKIRNVYTLHERAWVFDELTRGVFEFDLSKMEMRLLFFADVPYRKDYVRGLFYYDNKIVLSPRLLSDPWAFYNYDDGSVYYLSLSSKDMVISSVELLDGTTYVFPANSDEPIVLIDINSFSIIKEYEKWNNIKNPCYCWGAYSTEDSILFPIVGTRYFCRLNREYCEEITVSYDNAIWSMCEFNSNIWILPANGEKVYICDYKGKVIDNIDLEFQSYKYKTSNYARIFPSSSYVFLLPKKGTCIIRITDKKKIDVLEVEMSPMHHFYEPPITVDWWGVVSRDEDILLLPWRYDMTLIDNRSNKLIEFPATVINQDMQNYEDLVKKRINGEITIEQDEYSLSSFLYYLI